MLILTALKGDRGEPALPDLRHLNGLLLVMLLTSVESLASSGINDFLQLFRIESIEDVEPILSIYLPAFSKLGRDIPLQVNVSLIVAIEVLDVDFRIPGDVNSLNLA